jgi:hypothetical protein
MGTDLVAVNPATGEVLEHLEQQPPDVLAEALDAVHRRQDELKRWSDALEAELRRRLKLRGSRLVVFGDWEVEAPRSRRSDWDAGGLEPILQQLAEEGVIRAGEWADVITHAPVVSASRANALLARLDGSAAEAVEACRTWRETAGKVTVTRSIELVSGTPERVLSAANTPDAEPTGRAANADRTPSGAPTTLDPQELFA